MPYGCNHLMVFMIDINAKIFKLLDQKFDLVLFRIPAHIPKFFILISGNNFVNSSGDAICDGNFCLIGRA